VDEGARGVLVGRDPAGHRGAVRLGGRGVFARCRIIVPVTAPRAEELRAEVRALEGHPVDLVEWRADAMVLEDLGPTLDEFEEAGHAVLEESRVPVLATIRTIGEGGRWGAGDLAYIDWMLGLGRVFDAVDIEVDRGLEGYASTAAQVEKVHEGGAVVIGSHHDMRGTPSEEEIVDVLRREADAGCDVAKVAYMAREPWDLHAVLNAQMWAREHLGLPVIGISMGPLGSLSRIAGMPLGCAATFATVGAASAPGQFGADRVRAALDVLES